MTVSTLGNCAETGKMLLKASSSGKEKDFSRSVRSLVYGLWRGELDLFTFLDTMVFTLERHLTVAWYEGAKACGIQPSEMTEAEMNARRDMLANQYQYLLGFADEINKSSREKKGKLGPLQRRAELWVGRWAEFKYAGMMYACRDSKLKWVFGDAQHCISCLELNDKVYRASTWLKADIRPKMISLSCKGYKCKCKFVKTDEPLSPGEPVLL